MTMMRGCRLAGAAAGLSVLLLVMRAVPASAALEEILIPVMTIYPGDVIRPNQFRAVPRPAYLEGARSLVNNVEQVQGKTSLRVLPAGRPVPLAYIGRPKLVRPGMTVSVFFNSSGISITGVAQALGEGAVGEQVKARNLQTGVVISGYVQHDGSLRVSP